MTANTNETGSSNEIAHGRLVTVLLSVVEFPFTVVGHIVGALLVPILSPLITRWHRGKSEGEYTPPDDLLSTEVTSRG